MDISESIERMISNYFSEWLGQHPYLAWSISHPIPSLVLLVLAIFTLSGLIKAIGRGIEQLWLFVLKTPLRLLQPMFRLIWGAIGSRFGHTNFSGAHLAAKNAQSPVSARVERIVDRLQTLSQEQDLLLGELATLIGSTSVQPERRATSDTKYPHL